MGRSKQLLCYYGITASSSDAAVARFCKPGGNMIGITGKLCGRIINNDYGRWCGYSLAGRDGRELLIVTAYNVSQEIAA